jgi:hypothetical protein
MHGTEKALGAISEFHCSCRLAAPRKVPGSTQEASPLFLPAAASNWGLFR